MSQPKQPNLDDLLDFSEAEAKGKANALSLQKVEVVGPERDPLNRVEKANPNEQPFSWPWVWMSLGSFVLAQFLLHGVIFSAASIHGLFLLESMIDLFTYFLGGFMVGVVSPKIRVLEPTVGAVIALVMTLNVGMWMPFNFFTGGIVKTLIMSGVVAATAYQGAYIGEKLTRQMP